MVQMAERICPDSKSSHRAKLDWSHRAAIASGGAASRDGGGGGSSGELRLSSGAAVLRSTGVAPSSTAGVGVSSSVAAASTESLLVVDGTQDNASNMTAARLMAGRSGGLAWRSATRR